MKNNLNTTEELLENGKNIRLSISERDEMKSTLLSYANYHGVKNKSSKSFFGWSTVWVRGFASASLALILFVGTGYASASSLPGDFLYPVKTDVVEELTAATKLTALSQLEYHHERYETRLSELQVLLDRGQISEAAIVDSRTELAELSEEVDKLMNDTEDIDNIIALELVGDMVAMSNATEEIVRRSSAGEQLDAFEDITDNLEQVHDGELIDLFETGTSTIQVYIEDQLSEISDELSENDLTDVTTARVTDYVTDAELSLQSEDYEEVVTSVVDALTLILTEEYTSDYSDEISE
tara:strand:+ start:1334 stop:2221 length:888 start_codon:yes stop_codon:yes gene_type:complete